MAKLPWQITNEDCAEQQVREWQQETIRLIREQYIRLWKSVDVKSVAAVGRAGVPGQPQAAMELSARWREEEEKILAYVSSSDAVDEARRYVISSIEAKEKGEEFHGGVPGLLRWLCHAREFVEFSDAELVEAMREAIEKDAAVFPPTKLGQDADRKAGGKGTVKRRGGGREKDPVVQARNKKIAADFLNGLDVDAVTEKYDVSAPLARKIKSKAEKPAKNRQS